MKFNKSSTTAFKSKSAGGNVRYAK